MTSRSLPPHRRGSWCGRSRTPSGEAAGPLLWWGGLVYWRDHARPGARPRSWPLRGTGRPLRPLWDDDGGAPLQAPVPPVRLHSRLLRPLVPHHLGTPTGSLWCGTSARGAGPPSALGCRLAAHPPGGGELLPSNPSVPLADASGVEENVVGGALAAPPAQGHHARRFPLPAAACVTLHIWLRERDMAAPRPRGGGAAAGVLGGARGDAGVARQGWDLRDR